MKKNKFIMFILIIFITLSLGFNISYGFENRDSLNIFSDAVILIENKTGEILYEKNSEKKMYPASTTKILTAILTIEKGNLTDKTTVSKKAIEQMKPGYTSANLVQGEVISVEDLLNLLLLHSANDAANVLAEYISGSIEKFVDLMNEKLKDLKCEHSHFVTTNGLHDDNHYTTAKDMAILARYCMKNETFRKMVSKKGCSVMATNKSDERAYPNTNGLQIPTSVYYYPYCVGIKTGFTSEAKNCLISAAKKDGLQLIAVVLGASLTDSKKSARYVDSRTLFDYGFSKFSFSDIAKANTVVNSINVGNGTNETKKIDLLLQKDVNGLIYNSDKGNINYDVKLNDNISAPIKANSVLGTVTYKVGNKTFTENIVASHNVKKDESMIAVSGFVLITFLLILIILILIKFFVSFKKI